MEEKQYPELSDAARWQAIVDYQQRRYKKLCLGGVAIAMGWSAAGFLAPRLWPEPPKEKLVAVAINAITGEQRVLENVSIKTIPAEEASARDKAETFVMAREGYSWDFLRRDYDTVRALSTPAVFRPYDHQFEGPEAIDKKREASELHKIKIESSRPSELRPDGTREFIVTYLKTVSYSMSRGLQPVTTKHVATLAYLWQPEVKLPSGLRSINPLGFTVVRYRTDPVLAGAPLPQGAAQ